MNAQSSSRSHDRIKSEQELVSSIKKATTSEECAPKQKHVRSNHPNFVNLHVAATVFTWDFKTSMPFWNALEVQPLMADEIQTFKALITIHKVIRDGHPNVISICLICVFKF